MIVKSPMMDGDPEKAKLLVVAMSPGEEELEKGIPLVGPTGHMLWTWLNKVGISRADCFCINTIGELPEANFGKKISDEQYDKYWDRFDDAVKQYNGSIALVLGGDALWRFAGFAGRGHGIESWRGYLVEPTDTLNITRKKTVLGVYKTGPKKGTEKKEKKKSAEACGATLCPNLKVILPTLHPSGIMRTGNTTMPAFVADLRHIAELIQNPNIIHRVKMEQNDYNTVTIPYTGFIGPVVFDIEGYDSITDIGFGRGGVPPISLKWGAQTRELAKELLEDPDILKIGHNLPFDIGKLAQEEVYVTGPMADTMLMAALAEPDLPKGLKYITPMYNFAKRWDHLQDDNQAKYNALDIRYTLSNYTVLRGILENRGQFDLFNNTIMPCVPTMIEMSQVGLYVDRKRRDDWLIDLTKELQSKRMIWMQNYPLAPEPTKNKALKQYFKGLGMEVKFNKYGAETLDENAIRTLMAENPHNHHMLSILLDLREVAKNLSTYASVGITDDWTVHPSYLPSGKDDDRYDEDGQKAGKGLAGTFRPTAKNPNIQNQPQIARMMFIPRVKGHLFAEFDFNSFEARILAKLSGDKQLEAALNSTDFHKVNEELLGVDRTRAKNGFYCWSYGGGARTLFNTFRGKGYNVSQAECKKLLDGFTALYRKAALYRDQVIADTRLTRVVTNPFGFKRFFYVKDVGTAPANTMVQSTAAIILWKILPALSAEAKRQGGNLVAMVHDSVEFEVPEAFDTRPIRDIMQQPFDFGEAGTFSCPVDVKAGPSWGEVKKLCI